MTEKTTREDAKISIVLPDPIVQRAQADVLRHVKQSGANLTEYELRAVNNAIGAIVSGLVGNRFARCERCYTDKGVGRIVTISPTGSLHFGFPACMEHIQAVEAFLRNQTNKNFKEKSPPDQTTL